MDEMRMPLFARGRRRRRASRSLTSAVVVALFTFFATSPGKATVGARPADFTLRGASGAPWKGTFKLSDHLGKRPVVIAFTATWCAPCELEMMALEKERVRLEPKGLVVVAIAIDDAQTAPQVGAMARRLKVQFPVVTDVDSSVASRINPRRICPFMVAVDRTGKIVHEREGWTAEHMRKLPGELDALMK